MADDGVTWAFCGYVTPAGNREVQEWFWAQDEEVRDEIVDVLTYLQKLPRHLWRLPEFDAFDPDISEIRIKVGSVNRLYRIYGTFWPVGERYHYTFLLAKNKKVNKDKRGETEARNRLKRLRSGEAVVHIINFESRDHPKNKEEPREQG